MSDVATISVALIGSVAFCCGLSWLTERFIVAIDFMTGGE